MSRRSNTVMLLTVGGVANLLLLFGCAWSLFEVRDTLRGISLTDRRIADLVVLLQTADEALTHTARVYVATGDDSWLAKYHAADVDQLTAVAGIKALLADQVFDATLDDIARPTRVDATIEREAFALAGQGERERATQLLLSPRYVLADESQSRRIDEVTEGILHHDEALSAATARLELVAAFCAIAGFVLLLIWLRVAFSVRGSIKAAERARAALSASNQKLATSVAERTALLEATTRELTREQKMSSLGELASGIAHEVKTPLGFALDNVQYLKSAHVELSRAVAACDRLVSVDLQSLADEMLPAMDDALEGLRRIETIVAAMKDYAHRSVRKEPARLDDIINGTSAIAKNEWRYVAELDVDVDDALPEIPVLRDEMSQVILNLIVNASHAIKERHPSDLGHIRISARREGAEAVIRVADDGAGMTTAVKARLFERFFTTKPVGVGTGQGLALCHDVVVKHHGGAIDVESELGVGTTFVLRLPLAPAAA